MFLLLLPVANFTDLFIFHFHFQSHFRYFFLFLFFFFYLFFLSGTPSPYYCSFSTVRTWAVGLSSFYPAQALLCMKKPNRSEVEPAFLHKKQGR